ncbi:27393_t:CDS:2, partial [Gigaspora margarita]
SYRLNLNNKLLNVREIDKNSVEDVREDDRNLIEDVHETERNHEEYILDNIIDFNRLSDDAMANIVVLATDALKQSNDK